ncbi:glycosyltransferase [Rhodococcus artemisiae]|uniref:Glycosyltransferase n=1 Tax=Rhodococcus artemisiae TaxID=714159 RepID=A0ABU7LFR9_9NOCA|nr:glycosyltransferase [Rhodococcus artemisiae]MEE2060391.1 glycosyltransferase [Rhodococcus artemisiae]
MEPVFLPADIAAKPILVKYLYAAIFTRRILRERNPSTVIVMAPPAPAFLVALLFKGTKTRLIADLHTGFFSDPKWSWFTKAGLRLMRGRLAIVTNRPLAELCRKSGVDAIVLHDILKVGEYMDADSQVEPYILCPLSYANDEPIAALLESARLTPKLKYVWTGKAPERVMASAPPNVSFSGYVDVGDYERILSDCLGVVAVTDRDHTMQRAGYEALMAGKPQVTADFAVLREFLGEAALYVEPHDPQALAEAATQLANRRAEFSRIVESTLRQRVSEQSESLDELRRLYAS